MANPNSKTNRVLLKLLLVALGVAIGLMASDWLYGMKRADVQCTWEVGDAYATCLVPIDGSLLENEEVLQTLEDAWRNRAR